MNQVIFLSIKRNIFDLNQINVKYMPVFTSLVLQATGHVDAAASVGRSHVLTDYVSSQASGLT